MAAPTTDPLKPLEQMARRWALLAPAVPTALFVTFVIIMTILQPPATAQLASYALNIGSILVALFAFGLLIRYLAARGIRRLAPLTPRVKEAGLAMRGLSLLLDNGLLVSFFQSGAFPTMFFDADGSALHPRLDDALRWTRPRRLKFVRMVRSRTGPLGPRADLDALMARLGVGYAIATVHEARAPAGEVGGPRWVVSVTLFQLFGGPKVDRIASHIEDIESFLNGFLRPALTGEGMQAFPRWQISLRIAAVAGTMAGLLFLLVGAFLLPSLRFAFLTAGLVFIFAVALYGAYAMRVRPSSDR